MPKVKSTLEDEFKKLELTDEEIKAFEKELENYQLAAEMENPLEFYGYALNQEKFNGYVVNKILGGVHWSVVDYCLKNKIIGKYKSGNWFIVAEVLENKIVGGGNNETKAYNEFIKKWNGLRGLKERRLYAADKEAESFGGGRIERMNKFIKEDKEELKEKMGWGI